MAGDNLREIIRKLIKEYKENKLPFERFLELKTGNFFYLKKSGLYDNLITQYKKSKRRAQLITNKALFSNLFKRWVMENYSKINKRIERIDKNLEILRYIIYQLIEESKKNFTERKFLTDFAKEVGVSRWFITKIGHILDEFKVMSFDLKYGLKSISKRDSSELNLNIGALDHKALNNLLTIYFRDEFQKKYYSEPYIFKPISLEHPDGLIILKYMEVNFQNYFKNEFEKRDVSFKGYEYIIIDYTIYSIKNIKNKIEKYYPPENVLFLIVCFGLKNNIKYFKDFELPHNIKVISPTFFTKLMRLDLSKNNYYRKIFERILRNIENKDIDKLKKIVEKTQTKSYQTEILENELNTNVLSNIFFYFNKKKAKIDDHVNLIKRNIYQFINELDFPIECANVAEKIIDISEESNEMSLIYDHMGYVSAAIYLSAKFLFLENISIDLIAEKSKISGHPLKNRINELKNNDKIFNFLFNFSIERFFKNLGVDCIECKELAMKIVELAHKKIFKDQIEFNYAIVPTAVYLSANNLGIILTQEEIAGRSSIYNVINTFRDFREDFEKINMELEDIIYKKESEIIKLLEINENLTEKKVSKLIGLNVKRHLKNLLNNGVIKEKNGVFRLVEKFKEGKKYISNYQEFLEFYKKHPKTNKQSSNKLYYNMCRNIPEGTVRAWITRAESILSSEREEIRDEDILICLIKNGSMTASQILTKLNLTPFKREQLLKRLNKLYNKELLEKRYIQKLVYWDSKYSNIKTPKEFFEFYQKYPKKEKGSSNYIYFILCPKITNDMVRTWIFRSEKKLHK